MWKGFWGAVAVGVLPCWFVACDDGELTSNDFDRSCTVDSDCETVFEMGFCCSCQWAAINSAEVEEYEAIAGCETCALYCSYFPAARCVEEMCVIERDCAPFVSYPCNNDDCAGGEGTQRCNADGFTYGACTCG